MPHITCEYFPRFTDNKVVTINVTYKLETIPVKEEMSLLDSGQRFGNIDFAKAPLPDIKQELTKLDWTPMSRLYQTIYVI